MAKKKQFKQAKLTKKLARVQILNTLENSLRELQNAIGEKKFKRRIKKASKILSTGLPKRVKNKPMDLKNIMGPEQNEQKSPSRDGTVIKSNMLNEQV